LFRKSSYTSTYSFSQADFHPKKACADLILVPSFPRYKMGCLGRPSAFRFTTRPRWSSPVGNISGHLDLTLENYVCIVVALTLDLRKVSFYRAIEFLNYSSTIELLSLLRVLKGSYPSFEATLPSWKSSSAM